jgi:predicted unusual protein kinase regulating ubiquinone biosynthesis (AarF/ABC1/UbiB family)
VQPVDRIVAYFTEQQGLKDLTAQLSQASSTSPHPIAHGGLADIYKVILPDGNLLAVKCLRRTTHAENKELKVCSLMSCF